MAIPNSRMSVANATSAIKKVADFTKVNETSLFNVANAIPNALSVGSLTPIAKGVVVNPTKILSSLKSLGFSKQISSLDKMNMSISTASVMNKLKGKVGESIGNKYAMNSIFGNCPYDGTNLNMMNGFFMGLLPTMANKQKCSNGLISSMMSTMGNDVTPNVIGKNIGGIMKNVKNGKGTSFLTDLNNNADTIGFSTNAVNRNEMICSVVNKSDLDSSKKPTSAFQTMIESMDSNDMTFNGNNKVYTVAKKASTSKTPLIPDVSTPIVNKLSTSDLFASKSYISNGFNLFG